MSRYDEIHTLSSGLPVDLDDIVCGNDELSDDDFSSVQLEKVNSYTAPHDQEVVWRGYAGMTMQPMHVASPILANDLSALKRGEIGKPSLERMQEIPITAKAPSFAAVAARKSFADEEKVVTAPATPFHLIDTHFYCKYLDLNSVINATESILNDIPEVSRSFISSKCMVSPSSLEEVTR